MATVSEQSPPANRCKVVKRDRKERETLLTSLSKLSDAINRVVDEARVEYDSAGDVEKFVTGGPNLGVKKLWSQVANYVECLQVNNVKSYGQLERLWETHYGEQETRDVVERVIEAEEHHEEFLKEVEKRFVAAQDATDPVKLMKTGDCVVEGLKVTDAQCAEVKELQTYWERSKVTLFVLLRHFG